ncbi:hypothetical protein Holit_02203 [Hollandina sp. SP2]
MPKENDMLGGKILAVGALMALAGSQALFGAGSKERGNGEITAVEHRPPAFEVLYIRANADVKVHPSDEPRLVINAPSNLHGQIELRTKKNELEIRVKGKEETFPRFSVDVYTPPLSGLGAAFAANLKFSGDVTRSGFMVGQAGAAEVRGTIDCAIIEINMAGEGTILLTGSAQTAQINLVGNGTIDVQNLSADGTTANIVGAGKILTWTTGNLAITGVGNGTIHYRGTPVMDFTAVGSGRIVRIPDNS